MLFKPIPKKLLIHSVDYVESEDDSSSWGGGNEGATISISHVRFEPSAAVKKTDENEEKLVKGTLIIDAKHSFPFVKPKENETIVFEGEKLTVQFVDIIYADSIHPHHYEVTLT